MASMGRAVVFTALDKLSKKQKELSEMSENEDISSDSLKQGQQKLRNQFKDISKNYDKTLEKNKKLQ